MQAFYACFMKFCLALNSYKSKKAVTRLAISFIDSRQISAFCFFITFPAIFHADYSATCGYPPNEPVKRTFAIRFATCS